MAGSHAQCDATKARAEASPSEGEHTLSGTKSDTAEGWAAGAIFVAGVLLLLGGFFQVLAGISAILNDAVFVIGVEYVWRLDLTVWGWIHLFIGAFAIIVGVFVLKGTAWAAIAGIIIAGLSAVANFMYLPYQPIWALLVIGLDVLIIWALATRRGAIHLLDS